MDEGFNQPATSGGYFEAKNAINHLILITRVHSVYHNADNVYAGKPQPRDEAKVDLVDLDSDGQLRERVIVTHPGLVNRLVTGATNVLGRIGQVPSEKGNPAYVLNNYEPHDVPRAHQWVAAYQAGQFQSPAEQPGNGPQTAAPAQAPATAPAQVPAPAQAPPGYAPQQQSYPGPTSVPPGPPAQAPWQQQQQQVAGQQPWQQPPAYDEPPF